MKPLHSEKRFVSRARVLLLAGLGLLAALAAGCPRRETGDAVGRIKARGRVVIGVFGDKPPFGYIDRDGRNTGFDVAIARRIGHDLLGDAGRIEFVTLEASNRVAFLQSNKVDIILANFSRTPERAEKVDFARPYMQAALGVVAPDGSPLAAFASLKGGQKTLIVNKGTTADAFFTKHHPDIKLLKFDQNTEAFQALKDGRGDALSHDNLLLFAWVHENPGFRLVERNIGNLDVIAPAVKKGNRALLDWLDAEIDLLARERFLRQAFDSELRPFFGDAVKDPGDVLVEPSS